LIVYLVGSVLVVRVLIILVFIFRFWRSLIILIFWLFISLLTLSIMVSTRFFVFVWH